MTHSSSYQEADSLRDFCMGYLQTYLVLAKQAAASKEPFVFFSNVFEFTHRRFQLRFFSIFRIVQPSRFCWQLRPKHHAYHHICDQMCKSLYNARYEHCFRDESGMGMCKRNLPLGSWALRFSIGLSKTSKCLTPKP